MCRHGKSLGSLLWKLRWQTGHVSRSCWSSAPDRSSRVLSASFSTDRTAVCPDSCFSIASIGNSFCSPSLVYSDSTARTGRVVWSVGYMSLLSSRRERLLRTCVVLRALSISSAFVSVEGIIVYVWYFGENNFLDCCSKQEALKKKKGTCVACSCAPDVVGQIRAHALVEVRVGRGQNLDMRATGCVCCAIRRTKSTEQQEFAWFLLFWNFTQGSVQYSNTVLCFWWRYLFMALHDRLCEIQMY